MTWHVFRNVAIVFTLTFSCADAADYLHDIKPLLQQKCYACHGALKQQGELRVDTAASLIEGGESGLTLTAGDASDSLLLDVLTGEAGFTMPPEDEGTKLTPAEIELVREWIKAGASAPADEQPEDDPLRWWSYRELQRPDLPKLTEADADWCENGIDHFIAAKRTEHQLPHAAAATKSVWLRRVYLDLIGVPPTRAEQQRFLSDASSSAYETVVDDLLNRPAYGERWGRHWMDVWRYSDWYGSRGGNEIRYSQRHIWRWRDWIVNSLNADKGYDQMVREMLAADEIAGDDIDVLPATGYLGRSWYKFDRDVWLFETVERTSEAFLGMTLRCCRCHDHKFDPVTQEEYYRFRAFFEPHDVRTDPISALTGTQKDTTQGDVLNDGIALVYDKTPDAKTYRFERGDSRYPDETKPLEPGVPSAFGGTLQVHPVTLPATAWYPLLKPSVRETLIAKAQQQLSVAEQTLAKAVEQAAAANERLTRSEDAVKDNASPAVLLHDDFSTARPDVWQVLSGQWEYQDGALLQSSVASFATLVSRIPITGDFRVTLRYRPLVEGALRSIGFSFDYLDQGNSQDVYTSTSDTGQSVQAFHRVGGKQVYPKPGIVDTPLVVNEEATLDVTITGSQLTIDLNGQRKLDYTMPEKRRDGKFALWVHQGTAQFLELTVNQQPDSIETLQRRKQLTDQALKVAQSQFKLAEGELASVAARLAADVEKYLHAESPRIEQLAVMAATAEKQAVVLRAESELVAAADSDAAQTAAQAKLQQAQQSAELSSNEYTPLGEQFPRSSTGRRSALADWIVNDRNPRTARVAVNHIWGRHFGQPLVATPENFGLNGRQPTHPELLDWLATELIASNWKMKPLHRQLVLSATYRMASESPTAASKAGNPSTAADPDNHFLWRMNSRRMEAEVVRDSTLSVASRLDQAMGGPELPETDGEKNLRRSLYFRNTPNEKMLMLEVFDVADPNACYRRKESIVPHQSLAMMNSGIVLDSARTLATELADEDDFVTAAFAAVLARSPTTEEAVRCQTFLRQHAELLQQTPRQPFPAGGSATQSAATDSVLRAKQNLVHVLLLHNDFVTIR
ncbi:Planctomycete cytochrome C [Novipirellula galeiformis]|uniref:Planctomycete cytochrome C n=1 Tax=Novipirellula galeiformis TaxID=2528004 RepID=A0A5C6BIK8_9BACT|nr:PSD1 and planctomycete cytochrome C domain-containing protein [Novipirellula galeiformis]TWU10294.1 Planctomycete cytochrome C [Novipirellula galeiformis]